VQEREEPTSEVLSESFVKSADEVRYERLK
jgi:hypothetical protein